MENRHTVVCLAFSLNAFFAADIQEPSPGDFTSAQKDAGEQSTDPLPGHQSVPQEVCHETLQGFYGPHWG